MMVNILLISTTNLQYDGLTKVIFSICEYAEPLDVKISVLAGKRTTSEFQNYLMKNNIKFYYLNDRTKNIIRYFVNLCCLLKRGKFDVVHVHGNSATMAVEIFAAWICRVKIRISHVHSNMTNHPVINAILRFWLKILTTDRIACSHKAGMWLYTRSYIVVPNGIAIEKYKFDEKLRIKIKEKIGCTNKKIIGHIGRFAFQKNHEFIVQIFNCICQLSEEVMLLLVGEGELIDAIKNLVCLYHLDEKVIFYGTSDNIPALLSAMDVFVLPSRYEAFGIVGIEAQASGLQCFFSDTISQEIVVSNNCHFLSLCDSCQIWANQIFNVLEQNHERAVDFDQIQQMGYDIRDLTNRLKQIWHINEFLFESDF